MSSQKVLLSLRLFLLALAGWLTAAAAAATANNDVESSNRQLQEEGIALTFGVPSEPRTIQMLSRELFILDLLPENVGELIACSASADNGEIDMLVHLDAAPTAFINTCTSINDSPNEACPVRIEEENSRIYVEINAPQTTEGYTVMCGPADTTPLAINVATEPMDMVAGTFTIFTAEVTPVVTAVDSVLCTVEGLNGDMGISVGLDTLPLDNELPENACRSLTIEPAYVGEFLESCNVTVTEDDQRLVVYIKAFVDTEAVSVICRTCEAEFVDGISDIFFTDGVTVEDKGMECVPGWENYTLAPLADSDDEDPGMEGVTMSPTMEDGISADSGASEDNTSGAMVPLSHSKLSGCLILVGCLIFGRSL